MNDNLRPVPYDLATTIEELRLAAVELNAENIPRLLSALEQAEPWTSNAEVSRLVAEVEQLMLEWVEMDLQIYK